MREFIDLYVFKKFLKHFLSINGIKISSECKRQEHKHLLSKFFIVQKATIFSQETSWNLVYHFLMNHEFSNKQL